jgi:hypothetical protein
MKVSKGKNVRYRRFYLLEDNQTILQMVSNKKQMNTCRVDFSTITRVQFGPDTDRFKKILKTVTKGKHEDKCLSIIYEESELPLIFETRDQMQKWITGL